MLLTATFSGTAQADPVLDAREALRQRDRQTLDQIDVDAQASQNLLAPWIDYWALGLHLSTATQDEVTAFYARWPGSYVEDRMRNDWLLELGHRHDWKDFSVDYPRFRMNDDREVTCYAVLTDYLGGHEVSERARAAWLAQKEGDEGCQLLAATLFEAKRLSTADIWLKLRLSFEFGRPRAIKQTAALLGKPVEQALAEIQDSPARYLTRHAGAKTREAAELTTLALIGVAASEPDHAADLLDSHWDHALPADLAAWAWAQLGHQAALRLSSDAPAYFQKALSLQGKTAINWSADTLAWNARAVLHSETATGDKAGSADLLHAIERLSPAVQGEPAWVYWRAQALIATAAAGTDGESQRAQARALLQDLASPLSFYGRLAAEDLGAPLVLPAPPAPLTAIERAQALANAGLRRSLALLALGLHSEGVREWNFSMRGLGDRDLLAAAQLACDQEAWDRCISASERTQREIDMAQRFPLPHRPQVLAAASESGVDPAYIYGLIRQESRFVTDSRSHVGAQGLMQLMPATAQWTAKKAGIAYHPETLADRVTNLQIGAHYLKIQIDNFDGSLALAAAAYNAGPMRPRRWRQGQPLPAALWTETIPYYETRDYVKNVLLNTVVYAQLLGEAPALSLHQRLGKMIGPPLDAAVPAAPAAP